MLMVLTPTFRVLLPSVGAPVPCLLPGTTSGLSSSSVLTSCSTRRRLLLLTLPPEDAAADRSPKLFTDAPGDVAESSPLRPRVLTMKTMATATMMSVATIPINAPRIGVMWKTTACVVGPTRPALLSIGCPATVLHAENSFILESTKQNCIKCLNLISHVSTMMTTLGLRPL